MTSHSKPRRISPLRRGLTLLLLAVSLLILTSLLVHIQSNGTLAQAQGPEETAPNSPLGSPVAAQSSPTESLPTITPTPATTAASPTPAPLSVQETPDSAPLLGSSIFQGTLFLSLNRGGRSHLYAYHPQLLPITQLTDGLWDDITPAASPDGSHLAFASNRDGPWDLYLLHLASGETTRLTNTPAYDAAPSWSPDGRWLAYESYTGESEGGSLEIFLKSIPGQGEADSSPVQLTLDGAADYSPAWSPGGRQIAFVSDRTGEAEIWLADLDRVEDRFRNLSQNRETQEGHPAWSPDGVTLAWGTTAAGFRNLEACALESAQTFCTKRVLGSGEWPVWSPEGGLIFTSLPTPNQSYLAGYALQPTNLALPPVILDGPLTGLSMGPAILPQPLPAPLAQAASITPAPNWQPAQTLQAGIPNGRKGLVSLEGVSVEYPLLQDQIDEAFTALRGEAAAQSGWDFLSSLEAAYVPLTAPLYPGMQEDWLYTGRAFAFNTAPLHAGWVVVVREDFGSETYWRVYLRARFGDGSMGQPLHNLPWSFDARSSGSPDAYEQGGALEGAVPGGYWVDFSQLAAAYGWERLPALMSWRSAYQAARYNEYVMTGRLDWRSAMLEIYPPEALAAP